ncbi:MAG: M14 family metallocarboxypeptidase [Burkholderiaceae bacterium]|nr:M14 family metallocarboxypeptidase [Burkholderiaceae bacterium]
MVQRTPPRLLSSARPHSGVAAAMSPSVRWQRGTPVLLALLLSACSSTPLPPWGSSPAPRPVVRVPPPQRPVALAGTPVAAEPMPSVVVTPLPTVYGAAATDTPPAADPAAVADRFPDPAVAYRTPGLAPGRHAFTTHNELQAWLEQQASAAPRKGLRARMLPVGTSQTGENLAALLLTRAAQTDPASLEADGRPTVLLMGQQQGDGPASSEALLVIAQELAQGALAPLLDRIHVVVLPRANPDGAHLGQRHTANGIDLDQDHLLLRTPEAQALALLVRDYRPLVVLDAREYPVATHPLQKFNGLPGADAFVQYTTTANYPEFLTKASREWIYQPMVSALQAQGLSSDWLLTTSAQPEDRRLAIGNGLGTQHSRNVQGLKNAISIDIATRGADLGEQHIQRRVHTQVVALRSALRSIAERATQLQQVRSFVDRDTSAQACRESLVVEATPTPTQRELILLDPRTGAERRLQLEADSSLLPRPVRTRTQACGYWLAADATQAVERLQLLGVQVLRLAEAGSMLAETYEASAPGTTAPQIQRVRSAIDVPAASFYVPLNQPLAYLAAAALEPDTPDSYVSHALIAGLPQIARILSAPALAFTEGL